MKKLPYFILLGAISAFLACKSSVKPIQISKNISLQAFTDTLKLDTFKIELKGEKSAKMNLVFTITSYKGQKIYEKIISANQLLKSYLASADLKKEEEKVQFLTEEVAHFFEEEQFLVPAVMPNEKADKNMPDISFYEELKKTQLNGFSYSLGKEVKIYIAWSVKAQQVQIYYKCC